MYLVQNFELNRCLFRGLLFIVIYTFCITFSAIFWFKAVLGEDEFEDTKGVIRISKSKKDRQRNGQKKRTNKNRVTRILVTWQPLIERARTICHMAGEGGTRSSSVGSNLENRHQYPAKQTMFKHLYYLNTYWWKLITFNYIV